MRDRVKTRTAILDAAFDHVYKRGFQATSVDKIVAQTNLTKGAFFHYFPTKSELGYALVDEVLRHMMLDRWIKPLSAYKNPVQGMIVRFRKLIEATKDEEMALGCPLNNLLQEMSAVDPIFEEKLNSVLTMWIDETERYLKKAQAEGYLKKDANTRQVAELAVTMTEGTWGMVKNLKDRKVYWSLYDSFRKFMLSVSAEQ